MPTRNRERTPPSAMPPPGRTDWVRLWMEMLFLSSLVSIPLAFHSSTSHSIVVKDFLAIFFALHFLILGGALLLRERFWSRVPAAFWAPLAVYVLYGSVRSFQSPHPEHSWTQWSLTLAGMSAAIPAYLVFQRTGSARRCLWVLAFAAAGTSLYSVLQFLSIWTESKGFDPINWPWESAPLIGPFLRFAETDLGAMRWERFEGFGSLPGVCSTLGNPNFMAGFLAPFLGVFAALALGAWVCRKRIDSDEKPLFPMWGAAAMVLLCGVALFLTGSRGIVLAVVGVGIGLSYFLGGEMRSRGAKGWGALWTGLALVGLIGAPTAIVAFFWPSNAERAETLVGSVENRSIVYLCTTWLIRDHLGFGVTPGNFTIRFPDYLTGDEAEKYGWMEAPEEKVLEHAHSEFLEIASDLGMVGLFLWGAALWGWFRFMGLGWKAIPGARSRWLIAGLVAGVLGVLLQDAISVSLRWVAGAWIYWAFIGAGVGWVRGRLQQEDIEGARPFPVGAAMVGCALALLLFLPSAKRFTADWHFVKGRELVSVLSPEAEKFFLRSIELNPRYPQSYYLLGGYYYAQGRFEEAIRHYEEVRRIRGEVVVLTENLATTYFKLSTTLEMEADRQIALLSAIELYEASLERHPTFPRLYDYLSRAYQRIGLERLAVEHRRKAIELYERWFTWEYRYGRARYALDLGKCYFLEGEYEKAFWQARNAKRWGERPESLDALKRVLFEADPSLISLWEREDQKETGDPQ